MSSQLSGGLKVTVEDFLHAAPVFQQAGDELGRLAEDVGGSLADLGSFWGSDPPGAKFAATYLKTQDAILSRLGTAAGAVSGTGKGLQQMAASYGITEATNLAVVEAVRESENDDLSSILTRKIVRPPASLLAVPGGRPVSVAGPRPLPMPSPRAQTAPVPPSSGASARGPGPAVAPSPQPEAKPVPVSGSSLVGEIMWQLGIPWPLADQNRLMDAGDLWTRLADGIHDIVAAANNEATSISANNHGRAVDAFASYWKAYGDRNSGELAQLAEGCRSVAKGCYRYAQAVISAKHKIEEAGAEFAAVLVVSTIAAYFTFGATEAAADAIGGVLLGAARAALGWLEFEEVPAIVADIIATLGEFGGMAMAGIFTTNASQAAEDLVEMAFGENPPPVAEELVTDLKGGAAGVAGGALGKIGGSAMSNAARQMAQIGNAIASGEIKVADPAIAGSFLYLADVLGGPAGGAAADLSANAAAQLIVNHEFSMQDLTKDFVSSHLAEAIRHEQ